MDIPTASTSTPSTTASASTSSSMPTSSKSTTSERRLPATNPPVASSSTKKAGSRIQMTWNEDKDLLLLVEISTINPFAHKKGSKERGKCWTEVADMICKQGYKVDQRSVRDRYNTLQTKNSKKNSQEKKASGIAPEENETQTEIIALLEDLAQQDEDSENIVATGAKIEEEQKKVDGVEMRKRLVETFAETNKRLKGEDNENKRRRNSGTDTTNFMAMKLQMDREARAQELQLRKDEAAQWEAREEREQERRSQREAENERKEAERERREAERERKFELLQQQMLQQSNQISSVLMLLMQQQQNNK